MKRRSFLKTIAGALLAVTMAKQLGAKGPRDYEGFAFEIDPNPLRFIPNPDWVAAPYEVEFFYCEGAFEALPYSERPAPNPHWKTP